MSANVTVNDEGQAEMFSGQNIVPWHGLGTVVDGLLTSEDALEAAHLDWEVEKRPLSYPMDDKGEVRMEEISDFKAIVRKDNDVHLGIVKGRYNIIQNAEAFNFFDEVIGLDEAVFDTAGSLHGGKIIWLMAKLSGNLFIDSNPEDITEKNVLLVKSHDSTHSLTMQIVPTRVVCSNTLSVALKNCSNQIKVRHTKNYEKKIELAKETLGLANAYYDNLQGLMNELADTEMSSKEMNVFTERLFPAEEKEGKEPTRTIGIREKVQELFVVGKGNKGETRWDAINAVTEYVDFHRGTRSSDKNANKAAARFESGLLGSGVAIKQRAMNLLLN